jgi:hypothetical protein
MYVAPCMLSEAVMSKSTILSCLMIRYWFPPEYWDLRWTMDVQGPDP